jgi:hypothetical protein
MTSRSAIRFSGASLAAALALASSGLSAQIIVPGVGWEGQGADLVVLQLDSNPRPDMIMVAYDNPAGPNSFRYIVGRNLNASGVSPSWSPMILVPGLGWEGQGAGAATADLDGNGRPELILMAYDNPAGPNNFRYRIGWNLDAAGQTATWTQHTQVPGVGDQGQGAAVVIGQIDNNPRPDMIFIAYDNPGGPNSFRYRIGFNVNGAGNATWTTGYQTVPGVGDEGQGIGAALTRLDGNPRPDLVVMAYDNPAQGNSFRARIGLNLNTSGTASWSAGFQTFAGVGWEGQGAGLAITCLDNDSRGDWIVMAYDNPAQGNTFRYRVVPNNSQAPCPTPVAAPQRKSITDLTAQELASLRRGFAQMIAWNSAPVGSANYRRSLRYWANMHGYFGSGCAPASGINAQGMSGLTTHSKNGLDQIATWCTCQHNSQQFLTWHRMYLYYFEQVLQQAAGDPSLRLPFWDYELNGQLPAAYRDATWVDGGQTLPNPLRVANRQSQLNAGNGTLSANTTSTSSAMAQSSYAQFNTLIEGAPHGSVHCAIGVAGCPTGYMGSVPAAGNDPIFYSHHANIDRLYECWLRHSPSARLPTGPMVNATFSFIDGSGTLVTRAVSTMLTTEQLGYSYAAGAGCPAGVEMFRVGDPPFGDVSQPVASFDAAASMRLTRGVTRLPVRVDQRLVERLRASPGRNARSMLVIEGLAFDEAPQVLYNVYLEREGRRVLVGVINFFGRGPGHNGHSGADRYVLDATEALIALGVPSADEMNLVFEPDTGIEEHGLEEAVRRISPRANVRFDWIRFEVVQ